MTDGLKQFMVECVDCRNFKDPYRQSLPQGPYVITFVGGAKGALKRFDKLVEDIEALEGIKGKFDEILLIDHTNCAAHGGNEGNDAHYELLESLARKVSERFPHLRVRRYLFDMTTMILDEIGDTVPA